MTSTNDRVLLSVMGPHAGENVEKIFARKREDILVTGKTLWLCRSPAARPDRVKTFTPCPVIFLAPSTKNGARPTVSSDRAMEVSLDRTVWSPIPNDITPVTGNLSDGAYAFVLTSLVMGGGEVDLWQFAMSDGRAVRFKLGASTLSATKTYTGDSPDRMKTRFRRVLAKGTVESIVWVR